MSTGDDKAMESRRRALTLSLSGSMPGYRWIIFHWMAWLGVAILILGLGYGARAEAFVYFVVGEIDGPSNGDSYILPLEDADAIAHARDLIARGSTAESTIVVASIAKGADGVNRDVLAPGKPLWSWHVVQFEAFADVTAEVLDGWPAFVEEDVEGWIANTNGYIGFWRYTVVAELAPIPEVSTFALVAAGLAALLGIDLVARPRSSTGVGRDKTGYKCGYARLGHMV